MSILDPVKFDIVVARDWLECHSLRLLGENAIAAVDPGLVNALAGKRCVALVDNHHPAGAAYAVGAEEVWLLQTPPAFRDLRHYLAIIESPESRSDQEKCEAPRRWLELKNRARPLRREEHPNAMDVGSRTGLPTGIQSPFPVECLPPTLRAMVEHGARSQGVDLAMWCTPLIGYLAGAIGNSFWLEMKRGWMVRPILWTVTCCVSGSGKSPPLVALGRPHQLHDKRLVEESEAARRQHAQAEKLAKRNRAVNDAVARTLAAPPPRRMCLVDDATMEALVEALSDNPKGLLVVRDELAGLISSMDAYRGGRGGDEPRWLQLYDGRQVKVLRKSGDRPLLVTDDPAVSIVGTVQPAVLARIFHRERIESGFASRFLISMPPTHFADWSDAEIPSTVADGYERLMCLLLELPSTTTRRVLRLSSEAKKAWAQFYDSVNPELRDLIGDDDTIRASLVKMRGAALRIAIVLAVSMAAEDGAAALSSLREIGLQAMDSAVRITRWFIGQHALISSHQRIDPGEPHDLIELIRRFGNSVTVRTLMRATRRFRTGPAARAALDRLVLDGKGTWRKITAENHRVVHQFVLHDDAADAADADAVG